MIHMPNNPDIHPELSKLLELVQAGQDAGLSPENILSDDELSIYQEYADQETPTLEGHYDNIAKVLSVTTPNFMSRLANDVCEWVIDDELTRKPWFKRESDGIKLLGLAEKGVNSPAFEGASELDHPLLIQACTDFHSRAIAELFPPEGPVKTQVLGLQSPETVDQAQRVQEYMNYQYLEDMPGSFEEEDALLFRLPLSGSMFKETEYDPLLRKIVTRKIEPSDFIVPYSATDLETAPRFTHRLRKSHNWVLKNIDAGFFIEGNLNQATLNDLFDRSEVMDEIDDTEGRIRTSTEYDELHTIYKMSVYLDVPGFEHISERTGEVSGIELPYVVWVDRDNQAVLRIERNWKEGDDLYTREVNVTHKRFMPGFGFYGFGFYHLLAGLSRAASGVLNAIMDSAAFYNLQGGFRPRNSKMKGGDFSPLAPGEWREVDLTPEELRNAFFHVPYKEPSPVLFQLLGYLDTQYKGFTGGDVMTGEANANAPVGTTLALIEQGMKKVSSIHRRLHVANRTEFRILARLNSMYLPVNGYPFSVKDNNNLIFPYDFDERVDILPVSDPAIVSQSQRIVQGQAILDLADRFAEVDKKEACKRMFEAMRVQNIDLLLPEDTAQAKFAQQMQELEVALKQAQIDKLKAEATESAIRGLFSAVQAAQLIVVNPSVVTVADELYLSAGGEDKNGAPLASMPSMQQGLMPQQPLIQQNTSPGFPALPQTGVPATSGLPMPKQPAMSSPQQGIETPRNEGLPA